MKASVFARYDGLWRRNDALPLLKRHDRPGNAVISDIFERATHGHVIMQRGRDGLCFPAPQGNLLLDFLIAALHDAHGVIAVQKRRAFIDALFERRHRHARHAALRVRQRNRVGLNRLARNIGQRKLHEVHRNRDRADLDAARRARQRHRDRRRLMRLIIRVIPDEAKLLFACGRHGQRDVKRPVSLTIGVFLPGGRFNAGTGLLRSHAHVRHGRAFGIDDIARDGHVIRQRERHAFYDILGVKRHFLRRRLMIRALCRNQVRAFWNFIHVPIRVAIEGDGNRRAGLLCGNRDFGVRQGVPSRAVDQHFNAAKDPHVAELIDFPADHRKRRPLPFVAFG